MSKVVDKKAAGRAPKREAGSAVKGKTPARASFNRNMTARRFVAGGKKFEAVMRAAERSGLLDEKSGRIGGRVSRRLVAQAKKETGIKTDTDLIEFALASVALEDNFAEVFRKSRGKVDEDLKLGF
jgi:hypothetical protein